VYRDDGSASVQQIVTFTGTISANELYNVAVGELTGSDIAAMETFFGAQDYIYNGTSADDIFPEGATSVDGIVFNLTGDDDVKLLQGDDIFSAGDGNDTVKAASGDDSLYGGEGNDRLFGSTGNDYLEGGNGNDLLSGQRDNDDLFGGEGNDTLRGGSGEDFLVAGEGRDFNKAGFNDDVVFGGGGNDVISGNAGDDVLHGGAGDDLLRGGGGVDLMFGEAGDDRLKGGSGGDEFIMDASNGNDVIIDWDDEDTLIFADITEVTEEPGDEPFNVTFFDEVGISFTTPSALIADYASVTADGVLFDFGIYGSMLLEGLTTTDGFSDATCLKNQKSNSDNHTI